MNATDLDTKCFESEKVNWDSSDKIAVKIHLCKRTIPKIDNSDKERIVLDASLEFVTEYQAWSCRVAAQYTLYYNERQPAWGSRGHFHAVNEICNEKK